MIPVTSIAQFGREAVDTIHKVTTEGSFLAGKATRSIESVGKKIKPPIKPWEKYSPAQEIADILSAPKDERLGRLGEAKERLKFFMNGMVKTEDFLVRTIEETPDQAVDALAAKAREYMHVYGGDNPVLTHYIEKCVAAYGERRLAILKVLEKYPDKNALFEGLFGKSPNGNIEVEVSPITIGVACHNTEDFAYAVGGSYSSRPIEGLAALAASGAVTGRLLPECLEPDLKNAVAVMSGSQKAIKDMWVHENVHALRSLELSVGDIQPIEYAGTLDLTPPKEFFEEIGKMPMEEFERRTTRYFTDARDGFFMYRGAQDELLAYLVQKNDPELAYVHTKLPVYSYSDKLRGRLKYEIDKAGLDDSRAFIARGIVDDVYGYKYDKLLIDSVGTLERFHKKGYSYKEIAFAFSRVPISRWERESRRFFD